MCMIHNDTHIIVTLLRTLNQNFKIRRPCGSRTVAVRPPYDQSSSVSEVVWSCRPCRLETLQVEKRFRRWTFKILWMSFTKLIQRQQNLLYETTKSIKRHRQSQIRYTLIFMLVCNSFFFNFLLQCYRLCVTYSQNLRRIENWIVSEASSETVVRSYWTVKR